MSNTGDLAAISASRVDDPKDDLLDRLNPWRVKTPPKGQPGQNGPDCIWCNGPTQRAGTCFTCTSCGASTSC